MREVISMVFLVSTALTAAAQTTAITITNSACTNPQQPADVASPAMPSVAAGSVAAANRNFALARANFRPLAENGDPDAERAMGQLLMQDCTGLQDKSAAIGWLTKAVAAGNVVAENQLGRVYMLGLGVPQDDAKAFALFSQSAAANNAVGEVELGYLYLSGRGVPQDKYQALQWMVKSGEQGNAGALGNIAHIYLKGEILERDTDRAAYFLALANQRATAGQRNELMGASREIRAAVSIEDLERATKRSQRWSPGPGSLRDVLSDAEDFRRHKK
jgi:TPR repeat protein